jgi:uncharacterized membrane protein YoaK (UPF0700 family)
VANGFGRDRVPLTIPLLLSIVAGYIDSCTFLALFGLFVAQATGSFVIAGAQLVTHDDNMLIKILAIPVFFLAGMVTTAAVAVTSGWRYGALPWTLVLEEILLVGFAGTGLAGGPFLDPSAPMTLTAALLGLAAMGVQSALVRLLMREFGSTNVMTTNTTQLAIYATEAVLTWRKKRQVTKDVEIAAAFTATCRQLRELLPLVLGFLLGTVAGALAYLQIGWWCVLAPILLVASMIIWSLWFERGRSASNPDARLS